ncbi:copper chaperone PCu(A)C [Allopusillimonas ginsengisoli]|uniref:copper chaperone PCu(A)C n=1 Tax=Allopusillimonas ginsengisoli TaxID=453575 RepID=UPI001484D7D7
MKKFTLVAVLALGASLALSAQAHEHAEKNDHAHQHMAQHNAPDMSKAKVSDTISVSGCWIRAIPAPAPSGGYFVVHNNGDKEVKLQAAASPAYKMVMLHQTTQKDGMSKMSETHDIAIAAGGELEFKPGGYHAMLELGEKAPSVGDKIDLDLLFDNNEKVSVQCEVKPANTRVN